MLKYIYQTLRFFRNAFSRNITWLIFCMMVLGFIGASEMIGVTSFCRFWGLNTTGYHAFIHFFRASTWSLDKVTEYWNRFVLSQNETVKSNGRVVLQGDHTYVPKDGRQMPCVATLHQHSETQSKPSYFRGHCWGGIGMLIGSMASPFCTPLSLKIHQGLIHVVEEILITSLDLLWKPTGGLIRFVLAITSRGPIVLMCSDLHQDPVMALELYCARVRIETMFDMLKNVMGVFRYRFWTKGLPRHSRKPRKNKYLNPPMGIDQKRKVRHCFDAYERFVMIGSIALGLLQLIIFINSG